MGELARAPHYPGEMTLPGGCLHRTCPSRVLGRVNVPKRQRKQHPVLMLQLELRVKLTHDTRFERGSVMSLSFMFTSPPEDKYIHICTLQVGSCGLKKKVVVEALNNQSVLSTRYSITVGHSK